MISWMAEHIHTLLQHEIINLSCIRGQTIRTNHLIYQIHQLQSNSLDGTTRNKDLLQRERMPFMVSGMVNTAWLCRGGSIQVLLHSLNSPKPCATRVLIYSHNHRIVLSAMMKWNSPSGINNVLSAMMKWNASSGNNNVLSAMMKWNARSGIIK
ncbi:hypothetical protein SeMB42_g07584, partial [Synchytrium endobioticum]